MVADTISHSIEGSVTVSYTHLDVYKRQAIAFLYSGLAISILSIILTTRILGVEMGVARTVGAVSYTHLDVYKRQVWDIVNDIISHLVTILP